jgi:hypothetical protein
MVDRLTRDAVRLEQLLDAYEHNDPMPAPEGGDVLILAAEVRRLRAQVQRLLGYQQELSNERGKVFAEIEQLRRATADR